MATVTPQPRFSALAQRAAGLVAVAAAALFGGYLLRESIVLAGRASADDPRAYLRHPE